MIVDTGYEKSAHLYDLFDQKENIEFFSRFGSLHGEILDIGAGTGRIAIPLAQRGIRVYCVEPSIAMRREFEKKLSQRPDLLNKIAIMAGSANSFDYGRTFPACFLSGSFDHFLDDDERLSSLLNIGRHLVPTGVLVFDVFLGLMKDSPLSPAGVMNVGEREYRRFVATTVLADRRQETHLVFETYERGKLVERIEERGTVGIINREGLHAILQTAGFEIKREFCSYKFDEFTEGSRLLIVEARKSGGIR